MTRTTLDRTAPNFDDQIEHLAAEHDIECRCALCYELGAEVNWKNFDETARLARIAEPELRETFDGAAGFSIVHATIDFDESEVALAPPEEPWTANELSLLRRTVATLALVALSFVVAPDAAAHSTGDHADVSLAHLFEPFHLLMIVAAIAAAIVSTYTTRKRRAIIASRTAVLEAARSTLEERIESSDRALDESHRIAR